MTQHDCNEHGGMFEVPGDHLSAMGDVVRAAQQLSKHWDLEPGPAKIATLLEDHDRLAAALKRLPE